MSTAIVQTSEIVTLVGASTFPKGDLLESLRHAPTLVAADGGADMALNCGILPHVVIGDFDSIGPSVQKRIPEDRFHYAEDQNKTDFEKALERISAPLILAVGFTGDRLDHELVVYNAIVRQADRPVIVLGAQDICFHLPHDLVLDLPKGTRVSLFPMAAVKCESTGLRWPTTGLKFAPWGRVGTSNEVATSPIHLAPYGPGMLVILPRAMLSRIIPALSRG